MRRLIRRRDSEGLSYARLAKETGIPVGTLAWWAHRVRREQERAPAALPTEFVEVIPTADGRGADEFEVRLPSGIVLQVPADTDRSMVLRLLSALLSC